VFDGNAAGGFDRVDTMTSPGGKIMESYPSDYFNPDYICFVFTDTLKLKLL
jgi:hypothetical protein